MGSTFVVCVTLSLVDIKNVHFIQVVINDLYL